MRVAVIANPSSGRGKSLIAADRICVALAARGMVPVRIPLDAAPEDFEASCLGARAVVVVGGDGTVRSMAARLAGRPVPLAIVPTGTENLAAREFGFRCSAKALARGIAEGRSRAVDLGIVQRPGLADHAFLIMASVGFDADVVSLLAQTRRGPIGHLSYLRPILSILRGWAPPRFHAEAAEGVVMDSAGQLVIANARRYALGINPARLADPADGLLDLVVLPARGWFDILCWAVRLLLTRGPLRQCPAERASAWHVRLETPAHVQADGDPLPGGPAGEFRVELRPGALQLVDMRPA
jgi:diacylglycerol kinase (ATP)